MRFTRPPTPTSVRMGRVDQHDAADGVRPVACAGGSLDDVDLARGEGVDLGGVIGPPLLGLQPDAVEQDQGPTFGLPADDGLAGVCGSSGHGDACDRTEGLGQVLPPFRSRSRWSNTT